MIAEIQPSFASHTALSRKVEYHLGKIDEGNARVLYTSTGSDLSSFPGDMRLVSQLNDRVKLPYSEITLSLYPGENLTDEQWLALSQEYLREMGYEHACYAVILNSDKAHSHVHILTTTIDEDGKHISSSNNYARSEKISRALEESYGLRPLDPAYGRRTSLGENQYRQYYLNEALMKALRSYSYKEQIREWLQSSEAVAKLGKPLQALRLTNTEWQQLLGEASFYEAARLDGASKWQEITKITLPSLVPTIITLLLLSIGRIFYSDFGLFYQVPMNSGVLFPTTNVIDTYVYRALIEQGNISMSSAAGVYQSLVGFCVVMLSNWIVRKVDKDQALF